VERYPPKYKLSEPNLSKCPCLTRVGRPCYLTEWIYQLVLESQLLNKIVNFLFTITY